MNLPDKVNLPAELCGGRLDGWTWFIAIARPELCPIVPVNDEQGHIVNLTGIPGFLAD